jgi:hypothetical protein
MGGLLRRYWQTGRERSSMPPGMRRAFIEAMGISEA